MKALLASIAGLVVGYFASDLQPVSKAINESLRMGTVRGVDECIRYSSSQVLSEGAIRNTCASQFRKPIYDGDAATGRAGPRSEGDRVFLKGNLENKVPGFVTTWVALSFRVFDAEGKNELFESELNTWIEPLSSTEFSFELAEVEAADIEGLSFCPHEEVTPTKCIRWSTSAISGVRIK